MRFGTYYHESFPWGSLAMLGLYFSTLTILA